MVEFCGVCKNFGSRKALIDVSFEAADSQVTGFLGPNGAGKSTALNILTGYISSTAGCVKVNGVDILEDPDAVKKQIGYLPENPPLYPDMTVEEYLKFVYQLKKCDLPFKGHINEISDVVKITHVRKRLIKNLSRGYKQRIGIAQALIGNPSVMIFDEPTVGLDPVQVVEIRDLFKSLGKEHTVILSTHIVSEVEMTCDKIVVLNSGVVVADQMKSEMLAAQNGMLHYTVKIVGTEAETVKLLKSIQGFADVDVLGMRDADSISYNVQFAAGTDPRKALFNIMAKAGRPIIGLEPSGASLESVLASLMATKSVYESVSLSAGLKGRFD